jgi:hypothetical protein
MAKVIKISRDKLYPTPGRSYRVSWKWIYSYSIDGGTSIEYGTGLSSLTDMLKRKHRDALIEKGWAA